MYVYIYIDQYPNKRTIFQFSADVASYGLSPWIYS